MSHALSKTRSRVVRVLLPLFAACVLLLAAPRAARAQNSRPPNIVLIFCDDLGYADLGCFGAEKIKTPRIDRMAREGVRLTSFLVAAPVCTPSRAGLLTGRYPIRTGLNRVLFPYSRDGIDAEETTLAEALRTRGYATACIGKWHLGHLPPYLPTRHGFDRYFGIPYSNDMRNARRGDPPLPLLRDEKIVEAPADQTTLTERYTEEAIQFLRENRNRPFFLYLPHTFPHVPLYAGPRFAGRSEGGLYGDVVETIDWSTGRLLQTLRELGLDDNTLVIFTSDNGPWLTQKENGGSAGPLRNGKTTTYEGGVRVPFIARWPGRIPAGRTVDAPAISLDLFPTLVALAGGAAAPARPVDGRNILGLLTGTGARDGSDDFYYYSGQQLQAVRSGVWKLHLPRRTPQGERPAELYDLRADVGEKANRAAAHPEIVRRLTEQARAFDAEARKSAPEPKK